MCEIYKNFPYFFTVTFYLCYAYQCIGLSMQCMMNICADSLFSSMMMLTSGQLCILQHRLESIFSSATQDDGKLLDNIRTNASELPNDGQLSKYKIITCIKLHLDIHR